jgi:hypothetical protein
MYVTCFRPLGAVREVEDQVRHGEIVAVIFHGGTAVLPDLIRPDHGICRRAHLYKFITQKRLLVVFKKNSNSRRKSF